MANLIMHCAFIGSKSARAFWSAAIQHRELWQLHLDWLNLGTQSRYLLQLALTLTSDIYCIAAHGGGAQHGVLQRGMELTGSRQLSILSLSGETLLKPELDSSNTIQAGRAAGHTDG